MKVKKVRLVVEELGDTSRRWVAALKGRRTRASAA